MEAQETAPHQGGFNHPDVLENQTPEAVSSVFSNVTLFLQTYGWFVVFGLIGVSFLYSKLQPYLQKRREKNEQAEAYRNYDPEETRRRQEAMDQARRRLQEQHEAQAERYKEEQKKREEAKRKEKIDDWQRHQEGRGYRSRVKTPEEDQATGSAPPKSKKKVYQNTDYNPLMGDSGGGASYRPARRGGAGGGG